MATFAGFMSYCHRDNKRSRERIAQLRDLLMEEIAIQLGWDFHIFLDKDDIGVGQAWEDVIRGALDGAYFLFPIIPPGVLKRRFRRETRERFSARAPGR